MHFKKISGIDIKNKIIFIRVDMNVPIKNGVITDETRIKSSLLTIEYALKHGAKVIVATHLGRPTEGKISNENSVWLIAQSLARLLALSVPVVNDLENKINFEHTNIVMLENVRANIGEKANDEKLAKKYAALCDIFVHDAFATAHRAEASTDAIGKFTKECCAGLLMTKELESLAKVVANPLRPIVAIVGGSKVSTKLTILTNLADKVDYLIVGGGILNTFLMAAGNKVGSSLVETELLKEAKQIMDKMTKRGASVPLPHEVIVAQEFSPEANAYEKALAAITEKDMILDIGSKFAKELVDILINAGTIIWNGPIGVFEFDKFANGTKTIAKAIGNSKAFSLAGGGDTVAAINKFELFDKISYVSTAGGALLEFLEGKELPAIKLLTSKM